MLHLPSDALNWGSWPGNLVTPWSKTVTLGASNAKGSWVEIASSSEVSHDVRQLWLRGSYASASPSGLAINSSLDIGFDPAGGTSYSVYVADFIIGNMDNAANSSDRLPCYFPCGIPKGSSIALRGATSKGSTFDVTIGVGLVGCPVYSFLYPRYTRCETLTAITNGVGTSVTPGASNTWGSWTSLGSLAKPASAFIATLGINNSTMALDNPALEVAFGNGSSYESLLLLPFRTATSETVKATAVTAAYRRLPAGATLYARLMSGVASPASGMHVGLYAFGD